MKNLSLYISKAITTISSFAFNIYLARLADVEYYGIFGLFLNLTFLFGLLCDWGQSTIGPLEINKLETKQEKNHFLSQTINFRIFITFVALVSYLIVIWCAYPQKVEFLFYGCFVIFLNFFNFDWLLRVHGKFDIISARLITNAILNLVFVVLLFYFQSSFQMVFVTYCFALFASFLISSVYIIKQKLVSYTWAGLNTIKEDCRKFFSGTRNAFYALLIFNGIYSLNIPLLSYFSTAESTSLYTSYYTLFSSVLSLIIIAQDIYLPLYSKKNDQLFFNQYSKLIHTGGICIFLAFLLLPLYFNYIYPSSFKIEYKQAYLLAFLGLVFAFRLTTTHSYMIRGNYKKFLLINGISMFVFLIVTIIHIALNKYNQDTALVSLLMGETVSIACAMLPFNKSVANISFFKHLFFAVLVLLVVLYLRNNLIIALVLIVLLYQIFKFYKKLVTKELVTNE